MGRGVGDLTFDSVQTDHTAYLFNDTTKPGCQIATRFVYVSRSSDNAIKDSLNAFFTAIAFGERYIGEDPKEVSEKYVQEYIEDYRNNLEPMYLEDQKNKEDEESIGGWYAYSKNIRTSVRFYEGDLLTYCVFYDEYTGGAHGIYMTTFLNMDLTLMRPIRLDDLFVGSYQKPLTDLIWNQLMADRQVKTREELEDLGYGSTGDIEPTENFYLDKQGITFYYNVYEITPYSTGPVSVSIAYDAMEHLLGSHPILKQLK